MIILRMRVLGTIMQNSLHVYLVGIEYIILVNVLCIHLCVTDRLRRERTCL